VYLLLDYSEFTDSTVDSAYSPYAQILSKTNPAEAHAKFVETRPNGHHEFAALQYGIGEHDTITDGFLPHTSVLIRKD
jgi:hypothetical protein